MIRFRLKRIGRKGQPSYRVVLTKVTSKRDGGFIVELGYYNPRKKEFNYRKGLTDKHLIYWIRKGACFSRATYTLLKHYFRKRIYKNILSFKFFLFLTKKSEKKCRLFGTSSDMSDTLSQTKLFKDSSYDQTVMVKLGKKSSVWKLKKKYSIKFSKIEPTENLFSLAKFLGKSTPLRYVCNNYYNSNTADFLDKSLVKVLYKNGINNIRKLMSSTPKDLPNSLGPVQLRTIARFKYALASNFCLDI